MAKQKRLCMISLLLLLQAKANKVYIFHEELNILDGFDASRYSVEDLKQEIETFLSMGTPK